MLTTLADETKLEILEQAFHTFYEIRRQRFGFPTKPGDWVNAQRELDGSFIKTGKVGKDIVVSFHNPSIRDFMEQFLEKSDGDALDLLRGAHFYEQYVTLWQGIRGHSYRCIENAGAEFVQTLGRNLWAPTARTVRQVSRDSEDLGLIPVPHFRAAGDFCEAYADSVSEEDRDTLKTQFEAFADDYAVGWESDADPDWLRTVASDLETLGQTFGVGTEDYTQNLLERADEIETERAVPEPDDDDDDRWRSNSEPVDDVAAMFGGLESDLTST
ncbi:MAG: hypothetical protein ABMA15_02640 [Vicinamibacterales bacterium]